MTNMRENSMRSIPLPYPSLRDISIRYRLQNCQLSPHMPHKLVRSERQLDSDLSRTRSYHLSTPSQFGFIGMTTAPVASSWARMILAMHLFLLHLRCSKQVEWIPQLSTVGYRLLRFLICRLTMFVSLSIRRISPLLDSISLWPDWHWRFIRGAHMRKVPANRGYSEGTRSVRIRPDPVGYV